MAEAVVSAVVADLVSRAISLLAGKLQDRRGEGKVRRLRHLVVKLESVVDAADARRITSRALLEWLSELVGAAHRGRYFLDASQDKAVEVTDEDEDDGHGGAEPLRQSLFSPSSFNAAKRVRVAATRTLFGGGGTGELDGVLADMESVSTDLAEFIMLLQCCPPALHRPLATNIYAECQVFARHLERRRVIDFLLHDEDAGGAGGDLGVLPIIGRAGLGKTTLVQHVCDESAVRRHFSLIMLVDFHCMSLTAPNEAVQLLRSLFSVASTAAAAGEQLRLLERRLRDERFLAVFDNVDPHKKRVIDAIMPALRRGLAGSRIIVTGSDKHVVDLGTTEPIILRPLPPEEYWFFFKAHAFGGADDAEADPRLAAAGQAIARRLRLRGSFYGAKAVGALLRSRPDHRLWRRVLAAVHGESSWCRHGDYVAATAGSLLPPHVTVRGVVVSGSPVRGVVGLQDAALTAPGGGGRQELPVLLCKSIFPSYCLYYTARYREQTVKVSHTNSNAIQNHFFFLQTLGFAVRSALFELTRKKKCKHELWRAVREWHICKWS